MLFFVQWRIFDTQSLCLGQASHDSMPNDKLGLISIGCIAVVAACNLSCGFVRNLSNSALAVPEEKGYISLMKTRVARVALELLWFVI